MVIDEKFVDQAVAPVHMLAERQYPFIIPALVVDRENHPVRRRADPHIQDVTLDGVAALAGKMAVDKFPVVPGIQGPAGVARNVDMGTKRIGALPAAERDRPGIGKTSFFLRPDRGGTRRQDQQGQRHQQPDAAAPPRRGKVF